MDYIVWYKESGNCINSFESKVVLLRIIKDVEAKDTFVYVADNIFNSLLYEYDDGLYCRECTLKEYLLKNWKEKLEKYVITALDEKGYPTGLVANKYYKEFVKCELEAKCMNEP